MAIAAALSGTVHQGLDLSLGEILPNCTVYSGWCAEVGCLIRQDKSPPVQVNTKGNRSLYVQYDCALTMIIPELVKVTFLSRRRAREALPFRAWRERR